ncbi:MAG: Panacea domain-containing protein, partial [Acidimicrobiales bacterium]
LEPDECKLAELILYVAERLLSDPKGGSTKINKVLFAAEFAHMRAYGHPITGVPYQKLEHGPAPQRLVPVRDQLIARGAAELVRDRYLGYPLDRLVPRRPVAMETFTETELALVDEAVDALRDKTAAEASELSHREIGWRMVEMNQVIPYETAFLAPAFEVTGSIVEHAKELADRLGR